MVGAAAILALSNCSAPQVDYEAAVKRELRDPDSAQFSDVVVNVESACGFVNSKNGYGGYAGRQPFIVVGDDATLIEPTVEASTLVNSRCLDPAKTAINRWLTDSAINALNAAYPEP